MACRKDKTDTEKAIDEFVEVSGDQTNKKIEKITKHINKLKGMIDNGLPIMEKIVDQFENLKDPKALREKFEQGIDKSTKLTQEQKEALKKGAKDAFQFDGQSLATNKDKIIKMKSKIALEIARTEKENGGLKTMKQKVKFLHLRQNAGSKVFQNLEC